MREVWITSEDTGAYGRDLTPRCSLPELMTRMLDAMPDGTMLRVGMTNPPYILQHLEALAGILNHPRCYAFLHVPVQSGSDAVLGAMRREYTAAEFCTVADTLRARVPGLTIATDIICGFPGESEADHQATLALVRKYRFPILNISQFYPRPGTPAARMKRTPTHVAKERTREVSALFKSYEPYAHMKGEEYDVLATDIAADGKHLVAHDKSYAQVLLPLRRELLGRSLRVRVTEVAKFYVRAEILDDGGAVADAVEQAAVATLSEAAAAAAAAAAVGGAPDACGGGDCEGGWRLRGRRLRHGRRRRLCAVRPRGRSVPAAADARGGEDLGGLVAARRRRRLLVRAPRRGDGGAAVAFENLNLSKTHPRQHGADGGERAPGGGVHQVRARHHVKVEEARPRPAERPRRLALAGLAAVGERVDDGGVVATRGARNRRQVEPHPAAAVAVGLDVLVRRLAAPHDAAHRLRAGRPADGVDGLARHPPAVDEDAAAVGARERREHVPPRRRRARALLEDAGRQRSAARAAAARRGRIRRRARRG